MFFLNEDLARLSTADRLLYIGLWTQADKAGRLEDRPMRLKAALFPYDDLDVDVGLGRLANAGLITRYEGNGQPLVCIPTWAKHQRPHATEAESVLPSPVVGNTREIHVRETQERKGKDQGRDLLRERFERFWTAYPRKVGKDAAWGVWRRTAPGDDLTDTMLAKVLEQARSLQWQNPQFIPHPRTWLSQGRWTDEATAEKRPVGAAPLWTFEACPHTPRCGNGFRCHQRVELEKARERA